MLNVGPTDKLDFVKAEKDNNNAVVNSSKIQAFFNRAVERKAQVDAQFEKIAAAAAAAKAFGDE